MKRDGDDQLWSPTLIKFITLLTPSVVRASSSASERASAFSTRPCSVTTTSLVSTSMLNGLMSPSAASLALTAAVIAASSIWVPAVVVVLQATSEATATTASTSSRIRCALALFISSSSRCKTLVSFRAHWHRLLYGGPRKQVLCHSPGNVGRRKDEVGACGGVYAGSHRVSRGVNAERRDAPSP